MYGRIAIDDLWSLAAAVLGIIVIDLVLSGDNAVVIGMAAARLPAVERRQVILIGVAAAIGLRVFFTAIIAILLAIPYLKLIGGLMLIWIAYKLLRPEANHSDDNIAAAAGTKMDAIRTIVVADIVMSLDNILAVGGAAHGNVWLLLLGLGLSMPLITIGSGAVAWALTRMPWLIYVGSGVLVVTAMKMMFDDGAIDLVLGDTSQWHIAATVVATVVLLLWGVLRRRRSMSMA